MVIVLFCRLLDKIYFFQMIIYIKKGTLLGAL